MTVHVMIDLETWGTLPGSALRSIGAVTFDPNSVQGFTEQSFYCNIDRISCEAAGLKVDPETQRWWSEQPDSAQEALLTDPWDLRYAASMFDAWWTGARATYFWCNGACFDEPLLRMAFQAVARRIPWKYWNVRDTRTIWHLADVNPKHVSRDGVAHNALDDARHQAKCVRLAYAKLKPPVIFHDGDLRPGVITYVDKIRSSDMITDGR